MEPIFILTEGKIAESILMEAERTGDAETCYQAGMLYVDGSGVEQNIETAIHWLKIAATKGNVEAAAELAGLNSIYNNEKIYS